VVPGSGRGEEVDSFDVQRTLASGTYAHQNACARTSSVTYVGERKQGKTSTETGKPLEM
jgi:hypothetical protein